MKIIILFLSLFILSCNSNDSKEIRLKACKNFLKEELLLRSSYFQFKEKDENNELLNLNLEKICSPCLTSHDHRSDRFIFKCALRTMENVYAWEGRLY